MTIPSHSLLTVQLDNLPPTQSPKTPILQVIKHMDWGIDSWKNGKENSNGRFYSHAYHPQHESIDPTGAPGGINFGARTLTSIIMTWTEVQCSDRNGEITNYTVEYSSTTPPTTNTMSGSSSRELVVGGLLPRTRYTFTVRAEGGPPSSTSSRKFTSIPTG